MPVSEALVARRACWDLKGRRDLRGLLERVARRGLVVRLGLMR